VSNLKTPGDFNALVESRALRRDLAFHCISVHCNAAAFELDMRGLIETHISDHRGPGGIRLHPEYEWTWDPEKLEAVLEECEREEDYHFTRDELPNKTPQTFFWKINSTRRGRLLNVGAH
jgi:hypothetical protein